ncbi:MAG: hypothetical protein R2867_12370 [Caldilineaceae bacterium]
MKIRSINPWLVKEAEGTFWGEYFFVEVQTDEELPVGARLRPQPSWPTGPSPYDPSGK